MNHTNSNISLFNNVKHLSDGTTMDVMAYLYAIKHGKWNDDIIDYRNGKRKKIDLPLATICGVFSHRRISGLIEASGFICIDIDDVDPVAVKAQLATDKYTFAAWRSVSGKGVAVIFKINPKKHAESFEGLSEYLFSTHGIIVDPSGKDVSRARFVSTDDEIFINEGSAKFALYPPPKKKGINKLPQQVFVQSDFDEIVHQIVERGVDLVDSYFDWVTVAFALTDKFGEAGRNYFHSLSGISHKYSPDKCDKQYTACLNHKGTGVTISSFYYMAKQAGIVTYSPQTLLIGTVASQAKKTGRTAADTAQQLLDLEQISIEQSKPIIDQVFENNIDFKEGISEIEQVEIWLRQNYTFKYNEITLFPEMDGRPMTDRDFKAVWRQAKRIFDKTNLDFIKNVILSDFASSYNPLKDYISQNMDRQPYGSIKVICESITTDMPREYVELYFTKWYIGIVQSICWGKHSPLVLVLSGNKQGTGKTSFFRQLLPTELKAYYAECNFDQKRDKDNEILMCQKILVVSDDGDKLIADVQKFKSISSSEYFYLRRPFGSGNEDLLRRAVLGLTTNENDLLRDKTGNRRIIPMRIIGDIDWGKYNSVDKTDLLMEAYHLMGSGFNSDLSADDKAYLNQNTVDFEVASMEEELISKFFSVPVNEIGIEHLTATEIKDYMEKHSQQRFNSIVTLGKVLKQMGYEQKQVRRGANVNPIKCWEVLKVHRLASDD
ncbi:MAG: hypothetical protein BGO31_14305 [Bacteroidetes bacterium 43-16]|nr:MAG: hypothetical protein BGO31_14305 [Bacteroidetes bacterium 43-16]